MGLMQKAVETYESHYRYTAQNQEGTAMMAPVGHTLTTAALEITLDSNGKFVSAAAVGKTEPKIIIPVTEGSAGRTSAPCAHPLCDQIGYLISENKEKHNLYVEQLAAWDASEYSHPKLSPILNYVRSGAVLSDLLRCGLVALNDKGRPENDKLLVRWIVQGSEKEKCWLDETLFEAFSNYYISIQKGDSGLCMVSGTNTQIASQHPKGIIPISGNAKLISANDSSGFTYRGRFSEEWQASSVGYETSQKAHNALRWLIQEQGIHIGGRTFLCWNPKGRSVLLPMHPLLKTQRTIFSPSDYREELKKALLSKKAELQPTDDVVISIFDAATTGRLSLTYYSELLGHDFLQRLYDWDENCCWPHRHYGIHPPSLYQIVNCAFGTERGSEKLETDERILRQQMQRLIACRVDRVPVGADIVKVLVNRASSPLAYNESIREIILFTACAVIKKYRVDRYKEEWSMALEPEREDRSYQFGRLLAVMEKVERDTFGNGESREPNAIRMQSVFCQRPMYVAGMLEKQLERAYFHRLTPGNRVWYKNMIGQIMSIISAFPEEEWNRPLDDTYLMGYYLQRNALYAPKRDNKTEENDDE